MLFEGSCQAPESKRVSEMQNNQTLLRFYQIEL